MASSLGELFIELGVFADTKELQQFEDKLKKIKDTMDKTKSTNEKLTKSITSFVKGLAGVATAITAAVYALNKLSDSLISSNQEFLNLTRNTDIALNTFQKWNNIGRMFGVRNAAQQIADLNQRLYELKLTGQGAEGFILAGINPLGADAEGVMEQLRNRVAGLDDTAATFLLSKMGLDPSMLHLLRMTREEFEELGRTVKQYQLTETQRKQIQVLNRQLEIARIKLQYLKDRVMIKILPLFVEFSNSLARVADFLMKSKKAAIGLSVAITAFLMPALLKLFKLFWANPYIAAISALIGSLYLIIDDIAAYMNGGGSMIGVFLKALEEFQEKGFFSDNVPKWIQVLAEAADKLFKWWEGQKEEAEKREALNANNTAEELQRSFNSPYIQAVKNSDGSYGFAEVMPKAEPRLNAMNQRIDNSNRSTTVNQTNNISTMQPAQDIYDQLFYLRNAFSP